jgi:signal peptidase I
VLLCTGVGYAVYFALRSAEGAFIPVLGVLAAILIVVGLVYWLERDFRLSRLFRLQTEPDRSPIIDMVLHPHRSAHAGQPGTDPRHKGHEVSVTREVAETVVFVVVLVLLLKAFVAQAFVIPTGSMAPTLYGYQMVVECPKCGVEFPVNASYEVEPSDGGPQLPVAHCICPNCRYQIDFLEEMRRDPNFRRPSPSTGDRVLVADYLYDLQAPKRLDVVVFKYPGNSNRDAGSDAFPNSGPQKQQSAMNYIKRLIGQPGETIGIWYGKLYYLPADQLSPEKQEEYRARTLINIWDERINRAPPDKQAELRIRKEKGELPENWEKDVWRWENMFKDDLVNQLQAGTGFQIIRKPPAKILEMRRPVYDNDHPASDLKGALHDRWATEGDWRMLEPHGFQAEPAGGETSWLRYRNLLRTHPDAPELITDFVGYNTYEPRRSGRGMPPPNWVGDLLIDCEIQVQQPTGTLTLELSKGVDRFRAAWDLASGKCTLYRLKEKHTANKTPPPDSQFVEIDSKPTKLRGKGKYHVRFANIDDRLLVWVDDDLPFGDGVNYERFPEPGPYGNDLQPASIGVQGASLQIRKLSLWRDTYYTRDPNSLLGADAAPAGDDWADPTAWGPLRLEINPTTFYVQPGHYLCLGDNSPESSDGRTWGLVPKRLLLGRALTVYYPFYFPWRPLNNPENRIRKIK